jgi:hypothetical protein
MIELFGISQKQSDFQEHFEASMYVMIHFCSYNSNLCNYSCNK